MGRAVLAVRCVLLLVIVAACSSSEEHVICHCAGIDSNIDGPPTCEPVTQAFCREDEKCTWIWDQVPPRNQPTPLPIGHVGCTAEGHLQKGGTCGPLALGGDTCAPGLVCVDSSCRTICDPGAATPVCDPVETCTTHAPLFDGAVGVCDPAP